MQVIATPLNQETVRAIQGWLRLPESLEFRKLIASLITMEQCDAIDSLRKSEGQDDGHREDAFDKMDMAEKYEFLLDCMDSAAIGHRPDKPDEKFPFVSIAIEQPNAANTVEKFLADQKAKTT